MSTYILNKNSVRNNILLKINKTKQPYLTLYNKQIVINRVVANQFNFNEIGYIEFRLTNDKLFLRKSSKKDGFYICLHPEHGKYSYRTSASKINRFIRGHFDLDYNSKLIIPLIWDENIKEFELDTPII